MTKKCKERWLSCISLFCLMQDFRLCTGMIFAKDANTIGWIHSTRRHFKIWKDLQRSCQCIDFAPPIFPFLLRSIGISCRQYKGASWLKLGASTSKIPSRLRRLRHTLMNCVYETKCRRKGGPEIETRVLRLGSYICESRYLAHADISSARPIPSKSHFHSIKKQLRSLA